MNAINSELSDYGIILSRYNWSIDNFSSLFQCIAQVLSYDDMYNVDQHDDHVKQNLIGGYVDNIHLPVSVYSYIRPTMGLQFILYVMI